MALSLSVPSRHIVRIDFPVQHRIDPIGAYILENLPFPDRAPVACQIPHGRQAHRYVQPSE
ncbi:MAG: hypothetical protein ACI4QD_05865 [Kiritimatiellia bacterium]